MHLLAGHTLFKHDKIYRKKLFETNSEAALCYHRHFRDVEQIIV